MKVADILRSLVSLIDAAEQEEQTPTQQPVVVNINNGEAAAQSAEEPVADDELGVMIPPLQQKIELAKKAHGVDSVYTPADDQDELTVIKKHAGLAITADDEPFEG